MATIKDCKIKVFWVKDTEGKYENRSYGELVKDAFYKNYTVRYDDTQYTVEEILDKHIVLSKAKKLVEAKSLKATLDEALVTASKLRKKKFWEKPETKLATLDKPIMDTQGFIACYPYAPSAYNGELQEAPEVYTEMVEVVYKKKTRPYGTLRQGRYGIEKLRNVTTNAKGERIEHWSYATPYEAGYAVYNYKYVEEGVVFGTNGHVPFANNLICDAGYKWLYTVIEEAKRFGVTPAFEEGYYKGIRGLCIRGDKARELQRIVNWYTAQADSGIDLSDALELHHSSGLESKTVTRYEYTKHKEEYEDWQETLLKDFQVGLDADEDENSEE